MKKTVRCAVLLAGMGWMGCTEFRDTSSPATIEALTTTKSTQRMKNVVSIIEIPVTDFGRAIAFYQEILGVGIEEVDMAGTYMGLLPSDENTVAVALVKGEGYTPATQGAVVYLNAGEDLQVVLRKIEPKGGKVVVPKTEISPEMGFFALFTDTEGNKVGLHSKK